MQPCLALDPSWFADVQREIELILRNRPSSDPSQKTHPTNWTNPYGGVTQHSLYNTSGNTADTSSDHTHDLTGKSFVATECPALARLVNAFSGHAINFRLNGMMGQSGLSPHEENVIHGERVRVRLHLPVFTNDQVEMMLDGEKFHFREGYIYYFNNGCVHAAANGASQPRSWA